MPKLNKKLTEIAIRNAKPKDKNYFLFDDGGLRLLIRHSGTKVWQYPYRLDGKNNIYTIGKYGQEEGLVSTADARKLRDTVKDLISQGLDPNKNKKSKKQEALVKAENTFESIAEEWRCKQSWAEKHSKNIRSRLEKDVYPVIGWKAIKDVTIPDIIQILRNIENCDAVTVEQRINGYCTEIFDYAIALSICENNPALGRSKFLKAHTIKNRDYLEEKELPEFMRKANASERYSSTALAIKLLTLTLQRPIEVREAKWEEFNFNEAIWHIPLERMKRDRDHLVPLSKQALEILKDIKMISGNSEFLFPGRNRGKPISDVAMIKVMKKFSDNKMTPHGVRHTGSTILNENNFDGDWVESQLSHVQENKIRGTYNKAKYLKQRFEMMQWWADYLDNKQISNEKKI